MTANLVTGLRILLQGPLLLLLLSPAPEARWTALAVVALAGLTDLVDGRIARAQGQASRAGAMLDLVADRLLTATLVVGLIAGGTLPGLWSLPALVLLARCICVASFGEATGGEVRFPVTAVERVKIALQFAAWFLLVSPNDALGLPLHAAGRIALAGAALLTLATLAGYARRTLQAL